MANLLIRNAVTAALSTVCLMGPISSQAADSPNLSNTLPSADAGECYAKVSVPAVYKIDTQSAVIKQASEKIVVTSAKYALSNERVMVREASKKLVPVLAVYDEVEEKVLITEPSSYWVRSSLKSEMPASSGMLADLSESGTNVDEVKPGQCFYEFHKAASFEEVEDKVLIEEAGVKLSVRPAQFIESEKQVLMKPSSKKLEAVPAVYETVVEKVMVEAAHREWQKGRGLIERIDNGTGEIMCLINVPARFEEIKRQVIKTPASTKSVMMPAKYESVTVETLSQDAGESRIAIPAKYETYKRLKKRDDSKLTWLSTKKGSTEIDGKHTGNVVCFKESPGTYKTFMRKMIKTPASFKTVNVPAEYSAMKIEKLVSKATEKRTPVPEVTEELVKRVKVSEARLEWRPVLCETNMTKDVVSDIQRALNAKGYTAGKIDGVLGRGTLRALEKFQVDENLAQGGLTHSTIKALGVEF